MVDDRPPRVLLVTRNLPPLVGGMERLNWHMAAELSKTADVRIIGPAGSASLAPPDVLVREAPLTPLWKFLRRARSLARREARTWHPDVILAGSGLTAPIARAAARVCAARAAVYLHGLDVVVDNAIYRAFWIPAIRRMDRVIANSHPTAQLCRDIGVDPARIGVVHPGVDLPTARPGMEASFPQTQESSTFDRDAAMAPDSAINFRASRNLGNRPLLLSVGRLSERKGLREFVTRSLPRIVKSKPDVMLLIVGDAPTQALHARAQTPESIQAAADAAGVGAHLRFLGKVAEADLLAAYRSADVHVFPIRPVPGDPEGFGMVAIEAAANGLPTVAFAIGGVVDAIAEGESGYLVPAEDYAAFANTVLKTLDDGDVLASACIAFAQAFAWPAFGRQITAQLSSVAPTHQAGGANE